jgi:hypothetical protein
MNAAVMEQVSDGAVNGMRVLEQPKAAVAKVNAPGAKAAMVCGILGLLVAGFIFGGIAISKAAAAKALLEKHPEQYTGGGLATAGMVLGILDVIGAAVGLVMLLAS